MWNLRQSTSSKPCNSYCNTWSHLSLTLTISLHQWHGSIKSQGSRSLSLCTVSYFMLSGHFFLRVYMQNKTKKGRYVCSWTCPPIGRYVCSWTCPPIGRYVCSWTCHPIGRYVCSWTCHPIARYVCSWMVCCCPCSPLPAVGLLSLTTSCTPINPVPWHSLVTLKNVLIALIINHTAACGIQVFSCYCRISWFIS